MESLLDACEKLRKKKLTLSPCIANTRIFQFTSNKMQLYTVYLYLETALYVSGGTSTHHQERKQLYLQHLVFVTPLLLPAAIAAGSSVRCRDSNDFRLFCIYLHRVVRTVPGTTRKCYMQGQVTFAPLSVCVKKTVC